MKQAARIEKNNSDEQVLISFLKATADGEYAEIEQTSIPYSRLEETTVMVEKEYYYSVR